MFSDFSSFGAANADATAAAAESDELGGTVSVLQRVEEALLNSDPVKITQQQLYEMGTALKSARASIGLLAGMGMIDREDQAKQWSDRANADLAQSLNVENAMNLTMSEILSNLLLTWDELFQLLQRRDTYAWDPSRQYHENLLAIAQTILAFASRPDRMLYVGIGLLVIAFILYFLMVSK